MRSSLSSIFVACSLVVNFWAVPVQAQLPSSSFSPLNYLGRFHGFGYSDGYHACKDSKPSTSLWSSLGKPMEPMSSIYTTAYAPPPRRTLLPAAIGIPGNANGTSNSMYYHPFQNNDYAIGVVQPAPQTPVQISPAPAVPYAPMTPQIARPVPNSVPVPPSILIPAQPTPPPKNTYEQVPPAPPKTPESPSDRNLLDLPAPNRTLEQVPPAPQTQIKRTVPGTASLLQQSIFRTR